MHDSLFRICVFFEVVWGLYFGTLGCVSWSDMLDFERNNIVVHFRDFRDVVSVERGFYPCENFRT